MRDPTPLNLQHIIARAESDANAVRHDLLSYVVEQLGDSDTVLIVDETAFLKMGFKSVGVKRQHSGIAGCIENCHIDIFLAHAALAALRARAHAMAIPQKIARSSHSRSLK